MGDTCEWCAYGPSSARSSQQTPPLNLALAACRLRAVPCGIEILVWQAWEMGNFFQTHAMNVALRDAFP